MGTARTPSTSAPAGAPSRRSRLRHVSDEAPGYTRVRQGKTGFAYLDAEGREVTDEEALARIRSLAIPPAWEDVWICASEAGHLQATGRDARGRKQYRYHPAWSASRDETKFGRMVAFGEALPRIRRRVEADLRRRGSAQEQGLPRERVVALVVRLLDTTGIRVGNVEYARDNDSYGLTTFRNKHARVEAGGVVFTFRGKSGKQRAIDVRDPRLARIVQRCRDLPGYDLFQYVDEAGERRTVGSGDVNDYIREAAGAEFTAKDFRTWWGTVLGAAALAEVGEFTSQTQAQRNVKQAIEHVAGVLGNTVTVCRKAYVHPAVVDAYLEGCTIRAATPSKWLSAEERATLALLREALEG